MLDKLTYISIFWRIYPCASMYIHWLYTTYQNNQMKNIWSPTINQLKENLIIIYRSDAYNYFCMQYRISYQHMKLYFHKQWFYYLRHLVSHHLEYLLILSKINCLDYIFWNCVLNSIIFAQTILWMSNYWLTTNAHVIIL